MVEKFTSNVHENFYFYAMANIEVAIAAVEKMDNNIQPNQMAIAAPVHLGCELFLKSMLQIKGVEKKGHDLDSLFHSFRHHYPEHRDAIEIPFLKEKIDLDAIGNEERSTIKAQLKPLYDDFRYPLDQKGNPTTNIVIQLDVGYLKSLHEQMSSIYTDAISTPDND